MIKITVSNRLDNVKQFEGEYAPSDDIYFKVSQKLEKQNSEIIIFRGDNIVIRNTQFGQILKSNDIKLSYYDGKEIDQKIKQIQYSPIKKQTSIDSFKVISSSKILQQDIPNQEKIQTVLIQKTKLEEKLEDYDKIIQNLLNENNSEKQIDSENNIQSFKEITSFCYFCGNQIEEHQFQTPCCHNFHIECLEVVITSQITNYDTSLHCICKHQINLNILWQVVQNFDKAVALKNKILTNQLNKIQQGLKNQDLCITCNKGCGCIYFKGKSYNKNQFQYCARCEQKTLFNPW